MFKSYEMMQTDIKHNVQGGEGSPKFRHLFTPEELGNRGELLAVITLEPGESVGVIRTPAMAKPISSSKVAQP